VRVVNLKLKAIVEVPIQVGLAPAAVALSPDDKLLCVLNYVTGAPGTGTMTVVSTDSNGIIGTVTGFSGPYAAVVTREHAYVTNFRATPKV
jgi:DNA-binding beta-propeller fold protein YncE